MTILRTTNYSIAYADADTALGDYPSVTQQVAQTLDAALGRGGIAPPDATTQAQLAARITTNEAAVTGLKVRPVILQDAPNGATYAAGSTLTVLPSRTIDPAALFGAGRGALVRCDYRMLVDASVTTAVQWDFILLAGGAQAAMDSQGWSAKRTTFHVLYEDYIAPGATRAYLGQVASGTAGTSLTTYTTAVHNRARYTVVPTY
jgi:hypothetical protein